MAQATKEFETREGKENPQPPQALEPGIRDSLDMFMYPQDLQEGDDGMPNISGLSVDEDKSKTKGDLGFEAETNAEEADRLKGDGNELLAQGRTKEAVEKYSAALLLQRNAVYLANRALAYSRLDLHTLSIEDATHAIELDPSYVKGYYRRGRCAPRSQLPAASPRHRVPVIWLRNLLRVSLRWQRILI